MLKPVTGSWGRLLARVNGPDQARTVLEQKKELGSFHHAIFYVQEYVEKPDRDIRAYVVGDRVLAASYRTAKHWVTNAARGAESLPCPITPDIEDLALRACAAVGARLAGVDLIETRDGLEVIEVNTGGEFKGLMSTTDVDIAGAIVDEALRTGPSRSRMNAPLIVGVLLSRVRVEEKLLLAELERRGVEIVRFDDREFWLDLGAPNACDVALRRRAGALHQPPARPLYPARPQRLGRTDRQQLRGGQYLRRQAPHLDRIGARRHPHAADADRLHARNRRWRPVRRSVTRWS